MGSAFSYGLQRAEERRKDREAHVDTQRQDQLQLALQNATTPEEQQAVLHDAYAKDPSKVKQYVENLSRKLAGKQPQAAPSPYATPTVNTTTGATVNPETGEQITVGQPLTVKGPAPKTREEAFARHAAAGTTPQKRAKDMELMKEQSQFRLQQLRNEGVQSRSAGSRPVPYYAGAVSLDSASSLQGQGMEFAGPDGQPYDLSQLPEGSVLIPVYEGGGKSYWSVATDKGRYESAGNQRLFEPAVGGPNGAAPSLGPVRVPTTRSSTTTDPFGVTSTTNSTTTPASSPTTGGATQPQVMPPGPAPRKSAAPKVQPPPQQGGRALDANGHIPGAAANPQLVQAANSILDGMDVDKLPIPQRDRAAAMQLASQYGWKGQGLFTPREALQLREGATVIEQMLNSPSLKVLDQGTLQNLPMLGQSSDPAKAGMWSKMATSFASKAASPEQQDFLRYWRQLDALAIGLRGLVQTGRATQAQVERLIAELPNPYNTTSAEDARNRLRMVQNELKVAANTGKLADVPLGQGQGQGQSGDSTVDNFLRSFPSAPKQ